jgi:hypothetical protein
LYPHTRIAPVLWASALVALTACGALGKKSDGDGDGKDGPGNGDGTVDSGEDRPIGPDEEDFAVVSTVTGKVTIELFGEDENGERYSIPWDESGFDSWPFGPIFLAAYELGSDGQAGRYAGTRVIMRPEMGTSEYEMTVKLREEKEIYIYAAVDVLNDGVVGTEDPRGVWPEAIFMTNDIVVPDIDMTVLAQAENEIVCDDGQSIDITGSAYVTVDYWGGDIAVMLMDADGNGPFHVAKALEVGAGEGATTNYTLEVCPNYGEMQLISAWDANVNGIFDGGDRWGVYSATGESSSNPISVGDRNMNNYPVWMPLGDRPGVDLLPFVTLQGVVKLESGAPMSSLPSGTTIYVAALKYRPSGGLLVTDPAVSHDMDIYTWSEVSSTGTELAWNLLLPSDNIVYLWVFADVNGDGIVNDVDEPIGAFNPSEFGKTPTGQTGFGGIEIILHD